MKVTVTIALVNIKITERRQKITLCSITNTTETITFTITLTVITIRLLSQYEWDYNYMTRTVVDHSGLDWDRGSVTRFQPCVQFVGAGKVFTFCGTLSVSLLSDSFVGPCPRRMIFAPPINGPHFANCPQGSLLPPAYNILRHSALWTPRRYNVRAAMRSTLRDSNAVRSDRENGRWIARWPPLPLPVSRDRETIQGRLSRSNIGLNILCPLSSVHIAQRHRLSSKCKQLHSCSYKQTQFSCMSQCPYCTREWGGESHRGVRGFRVHPSPNESFVIVKV